LPLGALLHRLGEDGYAGAISIESNPQALKAEDAAQCLAHLEQALSFCREHMGGRRALTGLALAKDCPMGVQ
jgi:hypothetical protein